MRTRAHRFVAAVALAAAVALLVSPGSAGEEGKVWKQFLPSEAYQELVKRAAKNIEEALTKDEPSEEAIKKAQFNALAIAAYARSVKGGGKAAVATQGIALRIAQMAAKKEKATLGTARQMAKVLALGAIKGEGPGGKDLLTNPKDYLPEQADLMEHFKTKAKGGDGIHPSLQSNIRLKGTQNGIEEKLRALAMKKLSDANMKKEAEELALLGYRAAVVGELTYFYTPRKNAKEWQELSLEMRDAGIALADAAKKGDAEAVLKAGNSLNSSCNRCHSEFRK
jgi:hypothetical protein